MNSGAWGQAEGQNHCYQTFSGQAEPAPQKALWACSYGQNPPKRAFSSRECNGDGAQLFLTLPSKLCLGFPGRAWLFKVHFWTVFCYLLPAFFPGTPIFSCSWDLGSTSALHHASQFFLRFSALVTDLCQET